MNITGAIEIFLDQTRAWATPNTLASYEARLERFADFAKTRGVSTPTILEYKAYLATQEMKQSSVAGHFVTLKLFLSWAVKMELLEKDPMPEHMGFVVARPERYPITLKERDKLLAKVEQICQRVQSIESLPTKLKKRLKKSGFPAQPYDFWTDAINTAWHTGLRLCDVTLMKKASLDVPGSSIRLIPKKTKRFARIVHIPVPVELIHRLANRSEGQYVFPEMVKRYEVDGHKSLSAQFLYIAKTIGIRKGFHCLRHQFISRNLDEGVAPTMVADMVGLGLNQVMTYAHPDLETKREALGLNKRKDQVA